MRRRAGGVEGLWSARRRFYGPALGWVVGVGSWWLWQGGWWTVAALVGWALAVAGLSWWWIWGRRGDRMAVTLYDLAEQSYGMVMKHGATVVIKPSDHPEVPGEVIVDMPETGGDGDAPSSVREP